MAARRSGSTSGAQVVGLTEFRRELRRLGPEWPKELRKVHKRLADKVSDKSQAEARRMGGVHRRAASAIRGRANQRDARIGVLQNKTNPMANVAFWGAKKRTGWHSNRRYASSPKDQHPPWVGNTWDVGRSGEGPYAINQAIADHLDEIVDEYADMIDGLARQAFPDGRKL